MSQNLKSQVVVNIYLFRLVRTSIVLKYSFSHTSRNCGKIASFFERTLSPAINLCSAHNNFTAMAGSMNTKFIAAAAAVTHVATAAAAAAATAIASLAAV